MTTADSLVNPAVDVRTHAGLLSDTGARLAAVIRQQQINNHEETETPALALGARRC